MINTTDQEELFKLIANYIDTNISCVVIGGTAMMFNEYKTTTKDIDIVFQNEQDRTNFIKAIEQLGYKEGALGNIYDDKRKTHKGKPLMFTRGDERFDLFVKNVFGYDISFNINEIEQRNDFIGKNELTVLLLPKEELILLESITHREQDYEDIETILDIEKYVDWKQIVLNASKQKEKNSWILIDLEETIRKLQKKFFIKQEIIDLIYREQEQ